MDFAYYSCNSISGFSQTRISDLLWRPCLVSSARISSFKGPKRETVSRHFTIPIKCRICPCFTPCPPPTLLLRCQRLTNPVATIAGRQDIWDKTVRNRISTISPRKTHIGKVSVVFDLYFIIFHVYRVGKFRCFYKRSYLSLNVFFRVIT